ncbi:hypothetical protein BKE30_01755 [Alkanindiges hydrocarboniclasticus]|uniref:DUF6160 domain-containing protein n=1 Tax=Alkanindiges hydrocarboniclasticus TaxID=1907941 RepID=A0A1S8CZV9_9GAMM|nr:DUF6160 family protein [Alkanindiges hydrocarboniclasticus]ONG42013.1 hypothetical protein BKE30_01755 [Alkanindiges hydrocarboniclasticus]
MKTLTKLALVSAMAMSSSAFAMQSLDDAALSQTTGQDGVTIQLDLPSTGINAQAILHDSDGLKVGAVAGNAGAIVMGNGTTAGNFKIEGTAITLDIDADGGTANDPLLNVKITLPTNFAVETGEVFVAGSSGVGGALTNQKKIFNNTRIELAGLNVNMQLGNEAQGSMIKIGGVVTGGIKLQNFGLIDSASAAGACTSECGIFADIVLKDTNTNNLTLGDITVDADDRGLVVGVNSIGSGGMDVQMNNLKLGGNTGASLGNAELRGLQLGGTQLAIRGH